MYGLILQPVPPNTHTVTATATATTTQVKLDDGSSALSRARYLASTSGGSWFNSAFSYQVSLYRLQEGPVGPLVTGDKASVLAAQGEEGPFVGVLVLTLFPVYAARQQWFAAPYGTASTH